MFGDNFLLLSLMAPTHSMGLGTGMKTGPGTGKWVCNPLVPGPVPCPVSGIGVECTVKGMIYKPVPVPCSVNEP